MNQIEICRDDMIKEKLSNLYDIGSSKRVFQSEWREEGVPFYRAREIARLSEDGYVDNELFIDEDLYEEYTENNGSIEEMLEVLGKDSGIEEIKMFSRACSICRKNGGDLEAVCLNTSLMLIDKLEFEREAKAILSEKRMDTVLLLILPFAVLLFLNLCSYSYIKVLYEGTMGRLLMTAALVTSAAALLLSLRIMKSEL